MVQKHEFGPCGRGSMRVYCSRTKKATSKVQVYWWEPQESYIEKSREISALILGCPVAFLAVELVEASGMSGAHFKGLESIVCQVRHRCGQ